MAFFGSRILTLLPLVALPIVTAADVGSIALVHLSVPDDAQEAARAGMMAIQYHQAATSHNAQLAYEAAASVADLHRQEIERDTFTIYKDGGVKLTARKTAPTMMVKHIPFLRGLAEATSTVTVDRPPY